MPSATENYLDFEKPIADLEGKIRELRHISDDETINIAAEVTRLQSKVERLLRQTYKKLTPAQVVEVARHPDRPHYSDYVEAMVEDYTPLAGDRLYGEDHALLGGLGRYNGRSVIVMGHEKGRDTDSRIKHNFGMTNPEGYRKAQRLMTMAEQFNLPILTLVDTAGAYPGLGAEERGQSEAIARSIQVMLNTPVPIVTVVIGEGGSGGAIAIAAADRVYMMEHSIYSVISPEGCASILWRTRDEAAQAAQALMLTSHDLKSFGVIDDIISEPIGAAHRDPKEAIKALDSMVKKGFKSLNGKDGATIIKERRQKYLDIGHKGLDV